MNYYKIRRKSNPELFRKSDGTWNKAGKVYDTLGKLRAVITHHLNPNRSYADINDWEIVEYEVTVKEVKQLIDVVKPEKIFDILNSR
jgi:hypothetical protein